jgi:cobalt-precorrin 5A hydrolase
MALGEAVIVAGIGCRAGIDAAQIEAAIAAALATAGAGATLNLMAAPAAKANETGIVEAAYARGVAIRWISQHELEDADSGTVTRSARAMAAMNVHSVAEAAALAGAGPGARLLGPRTVVGPVTCALAKGSITQ